MSLIGVLLDINYLPASSRINVFLKWVRMCSTVVCHAPDQALPGKHCPMKGELKEGLG
jgi:hypothetical protein